MERAPRSAYCLHHLLSSFASRFDPAGFHSLNFILRRKVMAYRGTARAGLHSVFFAVSLRCNDAITLAFAAIRSQCHFCGSVKFKIFKQMKITNQNIKAIRLQFGDLTITAEVEARLEELGFTPETLIDAIGEHKSDCSGNPSIYCGT